MTEIIRLSWTEWNANATTLAAQLRTVLGPETRVLCLQAPSIIQGLLWISAAAQLGLAVMLDEKAQFAPRGSETLLCPPHVPLPFADGKVLHLFPEHADDEAPRIPDSIIFMTSGSTGQPKHIMKSRKGMTAECAVLKKLYQLQPAATVLGFVRPFHIYGFLHAWLLPIQARASLVLWPTHMHLPSPPYHEADLLIAVPSQWSLIDSLLDQGSIGTLVSSGAPFGQQRQRLLQQHPGKPKAAFEILGSTETGGIGYRSLAGSSSDFELLDGVEILSSSSEGTWITSPFLVPESKALTGDLLELVSVRSFRHSGRADRVFKYAGKRYALNEIEEALSAVCEGAAVVCHFSEDLARPQGGYLRAWVESEGLDIAQIRKQFLTIHALPFPNILTPMIALPRDEQGKVQIAQLLRP